MAEVNLTLGDPIEVKVSPAEGATNVSVSPAPQNLVQVQAAIATNGLQGADGAGVPTDPPGAAGQALVKNTAVANDTDWAYIDKLHINVRNKTGATIPAGSVVYASGLQGEDILIDLADASDASKMPAIGFTYEDIGDNNKGDVISAGVLVKNITVDDAGTADVGDTMYVSPATPGGITTVRPSDAAHKVQNVGIALKVTGNNNQVTKFKVSAIDRVNDIPNLEDGHFFLGGAPGRISEYQLPTGSPTNGQLLRANASGDLEFVNSNQITKNIGTVNLETSDTTRTLKIAEDGHLNIIDQQDASIFYIDEENKRVGINTTTLDKDAALFVNGNVLFKNDSTIGVEGGQEFNIGKIGSAAASATVNVTADLSVSGNCTIDTNLKFGTGGNQLHANTNNTFEFGKNGSGSADYKFNSDVGTVTFDNTTDVELKNAGGLKIFNSSNSVSIQAPSLASSYTLTLPNSSGTDGYVLKTDGSGTTSWVDVTAVSDAILDSDFTNEDSGLMKKTGAGTYEIAASNDDYQVPPSEGAFADGDKTKLDRITVSSAVDLDTAVYTSTDNVGSASFVVDEDDMDSDSATKVPTQQSVKAYVDSHVKTAIYSDASDNPQLASGVTEAEIKELLNLEPLDVQADVIAQVVSIGIGQLSFTPSGNGGILSYTGPSDADIRGKVSSTQNEASGNGALSYSQSTGVISYTPPDLSSYLTSVSEADVTAHEAALEITESQISDLQTYLTGSSSTSDLSDVNGDGTADGQLLIYNQSAGKYDVSTLTAGDNITITEGSGSIEIDATNTEYTGGTGITISPSNVISADAAGVDDLNDLTDVTVSAEAANDYLVYDNGQSAFVNQALDISHDTDPDLGGDLDVGDHSIVTSSGNKDITLTPDGTGRVNLGTYPIKADDSVGAADNLRVLTYVHSSTPGVSEIRLVSNPQGTVTTTGTPGSGMVAFFTSNSNEIKGLSDFRFDGGLITSNVLVEQGTLSSVGAYGVGSRITKSMFTDANSNKTVGDVYVMRSSDSVWTEKADADAASTASGLLAVATANTSGKGMLLSGIVRVADNTNFSSASSGAILYLDTEAGHVTATKPTGNGKVVRVVGYLVNPGTQAGNDGIIYFDPSKDWIELSS